MNWEEYKKIIEDNKGLPEDIYIIGIDLGTTNSVISYFNSTSKHPEPIDVSNGFGKVPLPSVVQFRPAEDDLPEEWIIGDEAYRSMKLYPETTIRSIKRKMGTNETVSINNKDYLPEEISAKILVELTSHLESLNPKAEIGGLVVSVPYDFDDSAKKATIKACEIAGLKEKLICLIEEPKAAALTYNFEHELEEDQKVMVFDFGGGTLDITIFHVAEKTPDKMKLQVISEGGAACHGGDNIDEILNEYCYALVKEKNGQNKDDLSPENQVEINVRSRETKERLSGVKSFRIPFTFCIPPFVQPITREQFEEFINDFIDKTGKLVMKTLKETYTGAITPSDIDLVIIEGGSVQMPWVKDLLSGIFNNSDKIHAPIHPAWDISLGATYYAAMKMGVLSHLDLDTNEQKIEFEVTVPHDIGFEIENNGNKSFFSMIRRGMSYATAKKSQVFTLSGDNPSDMTTFNLKILEKMDKDDSFDKCKTIGEIAVTGLPERPSGKTKLRITLLVEEEGGLVKGNIEDMGFGEEYPPCGFKMDFDPSRFTTTLIQR